MRLTELAVSRRNFVKGAVGAAGLLSSRPLFAKHERATPQEQLQDIVRVIGDASGRRCATHYWGTVFALAPGQRLTPLFRFEGNQLSHWKFKNAARVRKTSDTVSIFRDLDTNEILEHYENPFTGERVVVQPNRFLGSVYTYSTQGIWMGEEPTNVLYGPELNLHWDVDGESGQVYCDRPYTERFGYPYGESRIFDFASRDLADSTLTSIPNQLNSTSTLPWPKWMKMRDRPGVTVFHARGVKLANITDYPEDFRQKVTELQPGFYGERKP